MNGVQLSEVDQEKDLGVIISNDLKPNLQCKEVIKKANKLIGFIGRTFEYKSEKVIRTLYNSLVRPHLEYYVQFCSPYYRKDVDKLERVKRKITKIIPRLRNKSYEEHLKNSSCLTYPNADWVYKVFKEFDNINVNDHFTINRANVTRNNGFKFVGKRFTSNEAKHLFFNRVVNIWNGLPPHVIDTNTIETCKNWLDKYLKTNPQLTYFSPV